MLVLRCGLAGVVWCGIRMQAEACIHQVGLSLFIYQDDARSNKHKVNFVFDLANAGSWFQVYV